jgi:hypothetical protein
MLSEDEAPDILPPWTVLKLARYTVPLHVVLPAAVWIPGAMEGLWFTLVFFVIHLGFPVVLAVTYPWWRGRGGELAVLLVLNHIVTFAALGLWAAVFV